MRETRRVLAPLILKTIYLVAIVNTSLLNLMNSECEFYQVSGHRAHSHLWFEKYDDKQLIRAVISMDNKLFRPGGRDTPIELVLGILPSGASYLLMTSEQMLTFTHKHRQPIPRNPWKGSKFLSLSPIYFGSYKELSDKIATYKYTRRKSRREPGESQDNSKANRGYVWTGTSIVHYRGYFEQQRSLYGLLTRELEPGKIGLAPPAWLGGVRVVSLVFEEWMVDERPRAARLDDPRLVNVGWTDTRFPTFFERLEGASVHLRLKTNMINAGARDPCYSEVVEDDRAGLYQRLRNLLSHNANQTGMPLIVLVHDEDMARGILSRAGIELVLWSSGLLNLLTFAHIKSEPEVKIEEGAPHVAILPNPTIVDMQKLVRAVMETSPGPTVPHSAKVLRMQTDTSPCAGDDSLLLLHMWTSMAQGLAIDEQHKARLSRQPERAQVLARPQARAAGKAEADANDVDLNDADPNDVPPSGFRRPTVADDFSDSEDDVW